MKGYIFDIKSRVIVAVLHDFTPAEIIEELLENHEVLRGFTYDYESLIDNDDYENK